MRHFIIALACLSCFMVAPALLAAVPPCACPLWEAMYLPDETILYYCDYFPEENITCDEPEPSYVIGNYDCPADPCSEDCIPAGSAVAALEKPKFKGLKEAVEHHFTGFHLPGDAGKYSDVSVDRRFEFINLENTNIYAKVLKYVVHSGKRAESQTNAQHTFYVAFEVKDQPKDYTTVSCKKLDIDPCYAYGAIYHPQGGDKRVPILVLTAKK